MKLDRMAYEVARAEAGYSVRELMDKSGVSSCALYRCLNGREVRPYTIGRIAKVLGVSVKDLMKWE